MIRRLLVCVCSKATWSLLVHFKAIAFLICPFNRYKLITSSEYALVADCLVRPYCHCPFCAFLRNPFLPQCCASLSVCFCRVLPFFSVQQLIASKMVEKMQLMPVFCLSVWMWMLMFAHIWRHFPPYTWLHLATERYKDAEWGTNTQWPGRRLRKHWHSASLATVVVDRLIQHCNLVCLGWATYGHSLTFPHTLIYCPFRAFRCEDVLHRYLPIRSNLRVNALRESCFCHFAIYCQAKLFRLLTVNIYRLKIIFGYLTVKSACSTLK